MAINMIAGLSFLALAVYGWNLSWQDLLHYLVVLLVCLVVLVGIAMLAGLLLRKINDRSDRDDY